MADGAEWVEDLVDGLVRTLLRMGLINLDMMDLRAIVEQDGKSTLLGVGWIQTNQRKYFTLR